MDLGMWSISDNHCPTQAQRKLVAVFPPGGEASKNPDYTCCAENGLGLRELLKDKDFDVFVTADKEGKDSGVLLTRVELSSKRHL